jgi:hypothetical protein
MQNKANLLDTQMNVSSCFTINYEQKVMNYENKNKAKQTQPNPTCSELACTERGRSVEPIANQPPHFSKKPSKTPIFLKNYLKKQFQND